MPRPRNNIIFDLFAEGDGESVHCQRGSCKGKNIRRHVGNLERHLRHFHPKAYAAYMEQKLNTSISSAIKVKTTIEFNRHNIDVAIVEMFTKSGRPLGMLEDRAFRMLTQPIFTSLNINLDEYSVTTRIIEHAQQLKETIQKSLKGKLLSLKIDVATNKNLSVLGVNVQFVWHNKLEMKTLALKEIEPSHEGKYLKHMIFGILEDYGIDLKQILIVITDNSTNMMAFKELNDDPDQIIEDEAEMRHNEEVLRSEDYKHTLIEQILQLVRSEFVGQNISAIQSVVQTLQFCIQDVLVDENLKAKIDDCRFVAKKLRTQAYLDILKDGQHRKPLIDCETRWSSTYAMIQRLVDLREVIDADKKSIWPFKKNPWIFLYDFLNTFKPVYVANNRLLTEQLCYSDVFIIIMDAFIKTQALPQNEMSIILVAALAKCKSMLFEYFLFNAAIFMDPRVKVCLEENQIAQAKHDIYDVYERLTPLKESGSSCGEESNQSSIVEKPTTSQNAEKPKTFFEYLTNLCPENLANSSKNFSSLEADLALYDRQPRLDPTQNVLNFWSTGFCELSKVARAVLAIPAVQFSVKRSFEALKIIASYQTNRLPPFTLENILLIASNAEFKYE